VDKGNVQISDSKGKMKPFNRDDFRLYQPVWDAVKGAMTRSKDPAVRQLASTLETKNSQLPFWYQQQALPRTLVEVLTNSLKAVRSTSNGRGQVSVTAEVVGKNFVLSVKDSGVGLGGVDRKKLFKEGYTTKDNALGNVGLGLHYSKRVVKEMFKGKIEGLDNRTDLKAGAGATFRISIPLRQLPRAGEDKPKPQAGYSPPYGGERLVPGVHY
jgi:signal transduction histidine kinase